MKLADLDVTPVMPSVRRVIAALDKAPHDEVYNIDEMVAKFRCSANSLQRAFRAFPAYRTVWIGNRTIWGNPKAISALLKRKDAQ